MLQLTFKLADLIRYTGATADQLQHWMRIGLLIPVKGARSSGDHRQFSLLNLIEAAQAVEMARVHLTPAHMKLLFEAQRTQLAKVPPKYRTQCAWITYVRQVMKDAELLGETSDPQYVAWLREVTVIQRRLEKRTVAAPDTQILELLAAEQAARSPQRGGRAFDAQPAHV
jgi:DNA-binding transcriptional MerR regulator